MKLNFENELKNEKNQRILSFLNRIRDLTHEEIEQLKLIVMWESVTTFDKKFNCLFSTHLYNRCRFTFLKHVNKKNDIVFENIVDKPRSVEYNYFKDLPILYRSILIHKYLYKYTTIELLQSYKLKRWQLKILINDAKIFLLKLINDAD